MEAKSLGLDLFHYGGGMKNLRRLDRPGYPEIAGFWLDEMYKQPVRVTVSRIRECEKAYRKEGKFIPLQMINLCRSRTPRALQYYELADAACSAYGFHGGAIGADFGRVADLPRREYRLARRAFMPYFRNAEMPVLINPETKEVIGRSPTHRRCIEPREERWMTYGCLIQGAKGIMHWNYGAGIRRPPNWFSKKHTVIRASMGGALHHDPHGYRIPPDMAAELERTWDEIGRINVELQAVGPLVAVSDVSGRAEVVRCKPKHSPSGEAAVEAAALVSGVDSIVLIVLNQNIKTNWTGKVDRGIESYTPVCATVDVSLPPWLEPECCFAVRHSGVREMRPERKKKRLRFVFPEIEVSEVVVMTRRKELMASIARTVRKLSGRLSVIGKH